MITKISSDLLRQLRAFLRKGVGVKPKKMKQKRKYTKLKKFLIVLSLLLIAFFTYVEIVNRNSVNMTYRQKILKAIYPAWMWVAKIRGKAKKTTSNMRSTPPVSFYTLHHELNDGSLFDFAQLKGKKVFI